MPATIAPSDALAAASYGFRLLLPSATVVSGSDRLGTQATRASIKSRDGSASGGNLSLHLGLVIQALARECLTRLDHFAKISVFA
jgi:hypothetical protein